VSGLIPRSTRPGESAPATIDNLLADHATLADGPADVAAVGTHTLTNHGGSVISGADLVLIFPGPWYGDETRLTNFACDLVLGGYLDGLQPYGSARGKSVVVDAIATAPAAWQAGAVVTDATVQALVENRIANGIKPTATTLFMVMCPAGVTVQFDTDPSHGASCTSFCGYHSAFEWNGQEIHYGIICDTTPVCCNGGHPPFDAATMVLAHEIAEACTDAWPGRGWYEDSTGSENADLCAWQVVQYGPWTVQPYWTNEHGGFAGPYEDHQTKAPDPHAALWDWLGKLVANVAYRTDAELQVIASTLKAWGIAP
jgi:hypothetical protein